MFKKKTTKLHHGLITLIITIAIMFYLVVCCDASPHLPLILGCAVAGLMAFYLGYKWDEIVEGIVKGITPSLEALVILMLIGVLIATWIGAGTVPAMIFYGLKIVSAKYFAITVMVICGLIALAVGSWGTVGTVGIAFMGIGAVLQVNPALTAGAIVSGAYFGEALSPLSDATNLVAAVGRRPIFDVVKHESIYMLVSFGLAAVAFTVIGATSASGSEEQIKASIEPLVKSLSENFVINPIVLLPMILMVICILIKVPAIPSVLVGIISAMVQAAVAQGCEMNELVKSCYYGYVSNTGIDMIDELLSAGGISAMMYAITIIIAAMSFGGIMQETGQMAVVITPIVKRIKSGFGINGLASISSLILNMILPDQYMALSIPGQMFGEEYDKRGLDRLYLTDSLCAAGTVTSPLIPWNTCGAYVFTVLGISAAEYLKFAYFNIISIVVIITLGGVITSRAQKKAAEKK